MQDLEACAAAGIQYDLYSDVCLHGDPFFSGICKRAEAQKRMKKELDQNCRWYLIQFAIGFSLTLTIHFYSTMIAGLFCIGVAVGFCFRFARWKYFRRIMATGILSVLLSVLPMAAGVAMGKGLQGSLYWGLSVINGGKDDETEVTDSLVENTELSTISESEGTENRDGGSTVSASQVEALKKRLKRNWQNKRRSSRSH